MGRTVSARKEALGMSRTNRASGHEPGRGSRLPDLRSLRRRRGMTQRELADLCGLNQTTIYELEAGRRTAYPKTVRRLARGLNVEVKDLVGE